MSDELMPVEAIEKMIFVIRGQKVMLDKDLAQLYGVPTKVLNQATKRNIERFPEDFMFQLTHEEANGLRSQIVTSSWGGTRKPPFAFTEYGILMLSSVLNSERAVSVNIQIMRTFAKLRQMIAGDKELSEKLELLEKRVFKHDSNIRELVREIRKLAVPTNTRSKRVGFLR